MAFKLTVLISGRGSNLAAIAQAIAHGHCPATLARVVSDRASAAGLELARAHGVPTAIVSPHEYSDRDAWNHALTACVAEAEPDLVVLAGFMRIVGGPFLARFAGKLINVHPSLLPLFPGGDGPEQALAAGVRISGCSVHVVDAGVDTGPIIAQAAVPVLPNDDAGSLHDRIQRAEHALLPQVIAAIARGEIALGPTLRMHALCDPQQTLFSLSPLRYSPA